MKTTMTWIGVLALAAAGWAWLSPNETGGETAPEAPTRDPVQWLARVHRQIGRELADVHATGGTLELHHASDLSVALDDAGRATLTHDDLDPLTLRTARLAQGGVVREAGRGTAAIGPCRRGARPDCVHRAEVAQDGVTTWWEHHPDGIEQGWEIGAPLGSGALRVEVEASGVVAVQDGALRVGAPGAGYEATGLRAWDASGRDLLVAVEADDDGFAVVVETDGADWPVTVDPVWAPWGWHKVGPQDGAGFGASVALGGDVNGDGYEDALVGAPGYDVPGGANNVGRIYLYLGGPRGLATSAAQTFTGVEAGEGMGVAVAMLGDVNGDGFEDAAFGADGFDGARQDQGAVYVMHGTGAGLDLRPAARLTGGVNRDFFGGALAGAGDVNGDGYRDLVVGISRLHEGNDGKAAVFLGGPGGVSTAPLQTWGAASGRPKYGISVAGVGDINGDGYDDVAVGAPFDARPPVGGRADLFLGSAAGPSAQPSWSYEGVGVGAAVAGGDVTGDGFPDLLVTGQSSVGVFFGGGLPAATPDDVWTEQGLEMPRTVASGGDLDGDGYDDVLVGLADWRSDRLGDRDGAVVMLRGWRQGLREGTLRLWRGEGFHFTFGDAIALGDVQGDGYDDALIGAPGEVYSGDTYQRLRRSFLRGNAFVIEGGSGGPNALAPVVSISTEDVAVGDVDGDGVADIVAPRGSIATYGVDGTRRPALAFAASGRSDHSELCDVNGDGFDDLIYAGQWAGGNESYIWFPGSAAGLTGPGTPLIAWTLGGQERRAHCVGDVTADGFGDVVLGNDDTLAQLFAGSAAGPVDTGVRLSTETRFGNLGQVSSVAVVLGDLDVNGDGLDDIVVSDRGGYPNGVVAVWFGRVGGPATLPDAQWSDTDTIDILFGDRASKAGDVDGDGYDDILVTSGRQRDTRVHLIRGGAAGLVQAIAATWAPREADGTLVDAAFSGIGDVDGDGFDDIAIGEHFVDTIDRPYVSAMSVYRGRSQGPSANPWWRAPFGLQPDRLLPLGDINGDGRDDLLVQDAGGAGTLDFDQGLFVLRGRPNGMTIPWWP